MPIVGLDCPVQSGIVNKLFSAEQCPKNGLLKATCGSSLDTLQPPNANVSATQILLNRTASPFMPDMCMRMCKQRAECLCLASRMAAERPDVPFLLLDVEASAANRALAMEKTLTKPTSQRRGAKPILRGKAKFPAFSVHLAPSMQPLQLFTGPSSALKQLAAALKDTPLNVPLSSTRTQRQVNTLASAQRFTFQTNS